MDQVYCNLEILANIWREITDESLSMKAASIHCSRAAVFNPYGFKVKF
jgi:hypothetical protein